jgi:hypothetical protein
LTKEEKLKLVGIPEDKIPYFSDVSANVVYDNFIDLKIEKINRERLLELLNLILEEIGEVLIDKVEDFELSRAKLKQFNASKFVETYIGKFNDYGMTKLDIKYYKRKEIAGYYITLLKLIVGFYGYKLGTKRRKVKDNNQALFYYCKKNN